MNRKRILFIEDETFRNEAMFNMLRFDYDVDWAKSPKEAFDFIVKQVKFDLIILDIMLPVDDSFTPEEKVLCNLGDNTGLVLAAKFLVDPKTSKIPIILESAKNQIDTSTLPNVKMSLEKPFYYQDLKTEIENEIN
jgi:CheY-like chemotaxis protein